MIIYKITNKINRKSYIGQTVRPLKRRFSEHKISKACALLSNAMKKYGVDNFEIKILVHCKTLKEMNYRESYYIKLFKTLSPFGYNLKSGGSNSFHSMESKKKNSLGHIGLKHSEETKKKMALIQSGINNPMFGLKGTNHPRFGIRHTEEVKRKCSDAKNKFKKSITCNETGESFSSIHEAAKKLNLDVSNLAALIRGKYKSIKGLTFRLQGRME